MSYLEKKIKGIVKRWRQATKQLPKFPDGTIVTLKYRIRRFFAPNIYIPASIFSPSGAHHYLSKDPIDERVFEEIIGSLSNLFFPEIPDFVADELNNGGCILDVGAFNGGWGVEILVKYPSANGIFLEPSPEKIKIITNTILRNNLNSRAKLIPAGIAKITGDAWLVKSEDGSWGDWLEYSIPKDSKNSIKVKTTTLLDAIGGKKLTIIKCNAEGGEFELVKQILALGLRPKIIILMVHPEMGDVDLLWSSLITAGYEIDKVKDHPRRPVWHVTLK
jgi:FkbM family methyltransferase